MIANARMYAIDAVTGAHWRVLLQWVIARAGIDCEVIDYPPPLPLSALWTRDDLGCAFMCGYPLMHAVPAPVVLAAMRPSGAHYRHQPTYWTDLVVRADSPLLTASDALGRRLAYTTEDSQSGYQAAAGDLSADPALLAAARAEEKDSRRREEGPRPSTDPAPWLLAALALWALGCVAGLGCGPKLPSSTPS